jgi:hypothetical protein
MTVIEYQKNLDENLRSERKSYSWETFNAILKMHKIVKPRIVEVTA